MFHLERWPTSSPAGSHTHIDPRKLWILIISLIVCAHGAAALSAGFIENRGQVNEQVLYYVTAPGATIYFTADAIVFDMRERVIGEDGAPPWPPAEHGCAVWARFDNAQSPPLVEARRALPGLYNFFLRDDPARWRTDVPSYEEVVYRGVWPGVDLVFRIGDGELTYGAVSENERALRKPAFRYEGATDVVVQRDGKVWVDTPVGRLVEVRASTEGRFLWTDVAISAGAMPAERDDPSALLWSSFLGGSLIDGGLNLARDPSGDLVLSGITGSLDFPTTPGSYDTSFNGGEWDVFVAKFSSTGSALLWSTFLGGSGAEDVDGHSLALDPMGNAILTGSTSSANFPTTPGAYDTSFNGGEQDAYVAKLSSAGNTLLWSTFLGGSDSERGTGLAVDPWGDPVLTGSTQSANFPTTPGAYDTSFNGGPDIYITKLSSTGSAIRWSTFLGGNTDDGGWRIPIALDPDGNPILTGATHSSDFPATPGAFDPSWNGDQDVFVTKLASTGTALLWSTFLGGSTTESAEAIVPDLSSNPVIAGWTMSSDFPATPGAYDTSFNGGEQDAFVAKLSSTGESLVWSTFMGGNGWDEGRALALDPAENPVLTGGTGSIEFPITPDAYDTSFNGGIDVFVAKLSSAGSELLWSTFLGGSLDDRSFGLAADRSGDPVLTGVAGSSEFPTTPGAYDTSYNGGWDAFVAKFYVGGYSDVDEYGDIDCTSQLRCLPDPFRDGVIIRYELTQETDVDLRVVDVAGRLISVLNSGRRPAGMTEIVWDGRNTHGRQIDSGIYLVRMKTDRAQFVRKAMLIHSAQ